MKIIQTISVLLLIMIILILKPVVETLLLLNNYDLIFRTLEFIATVLAIFIGICIPYRIAIHQNKIALFEKRFEIYSLIEFAYYIVLQLEFIEESVTKEQLYIHLLEIFKAKNKEDIISKLLEICSASERIQFLFNINNKKQEEIIFATYGLLNNLKVSILNSMDETESKSSIRTTLLFSIEHSISSDELNCLKSINSSKKTLKDAMDTFKPFLKL